MRVSQPHIRQVFNFFLNEVQCLAPLRHYAPELCGGEFIAVGVANNLPQCRKQGVESAAPDT